MLQIYFNNSNNIIKIYFVSDSLSISYGYSNNTKMVICSAVQRINKC